MVSRYKHLLGFVVSLQGQLDLPDSVGMGFDCKRQEMKLEAVQYWKKVVKGIQIAQPRTLLGAFPCLAGDWNVK